MNKSRRRKKPPTATALLSTSGGVTLALWMFLAGALLVLVLSGQGPGPLGGPLTGGALLGFSAALLAGEVGAFGWFLLRRDGPAGLSPRLFVQMGAVAVVLAVAVSSALLVVAEGTFDLDPLGCVVGALFAFLWLLPARYGEAVLIHELSGNATVRAVFWRVLVPWRDLGLFMMGQPLPQGRS